MPSRRHASGPGRPWMGDEPCDQRVVGLVTPSTKARIAARPEGESAFVRKAIAAWFAREGGGKLKAAGRSRRLRKRGSKKVRF